MTVIHTSANRWDIDLGDTICTVWSPTDRTANWVSAFKAKTRGGGNGYMTGSTSHEVLKLFVPFHGVRAQFKRAIR